jgi:ribosomal protein L31E
LKKEEVKATAQSVVATAAKTGDSKAPAAATDSKAEEPAAPTTEKKEAPAAQKKDDKPERKFFWEGIVSVDVSKAMRKPRYSRGGSAARMLRDAVKARAKAKEVKFARGVCEKLERPSPEKTLKLLVKKDAEGNALASLAA